jgi:uncharacterized protein (DUF111 family)
VLGRGLVKCAHGKVPVPAPATLKILEGINVKRTEEPNEMTTPTGAAILKYYVKDFHSSFEGVVKASSYSTGTRVFETVPNILRGTLYCSGSKGEKVAEIKTNIDDCSPEVIASLFETLQAKTIDMTITQAIGKKNRSVSIITILCKPSDVEKISKELFRHTSTAGVRYNVLDRIVMDRNFVTSEVFGKKVNLKKLTFEDITKYSPEWDDCMKVAKETGKSPMEIYDKAKAGFNL